MQEGAFFFAQARRLHRHQTETQFRADAFPSTPHCTLFLFLSEPRPLISERLPTRPSNSHYEGGRCSFCVKAHLHPWETMSAARGRTSLMAWCSFARARWPWRSQALKFVKSAMVRRLGRIRTLEVELTRVHGKKKDGWTTCDFEPLPSATPQHVPSSAGAHQKQQRATESGAVRTTTCDPMNISDWRRVIQEEWTVPAPGTRVFFLVPVSFVLAVWGRRGDAPWRVPEVTVSVRCVRHCDVHILHRSLFIAAVNEMRGSEEEREAQCLLALLKGRWQEERAVLAWPLFHGFDYFRAVRVALRAGHFSPESQTPTANHRFQTAARKITSPSIQPNPFLALSP